MSASSTSVSACPAEGEAQDQTNTDEPTGAQLNFREAPGFIHNRPDLARHRRKCSICRHPERETIEDLFIHWHSPTTIANYFDDTADAAEDAGDESHNRLRITWVAIYRHAYAVGLDEVRRRNLRFAFEHILEQAGDITPTSASIMAAARAYAACLNNDGQWNDPPKRVIVTNILKREAPLTDHGTRVTGHEPVLAANESADIVAASLSRQPFRPATTDSPAQETSIHSHSGRVPASADGTTRNLHFGPFPESAAEIRNSANPLKIKENIFSNR